MESSQPFCISLCLLPVKIAGIIVITSSTPRPFSHSNKHALNICGTCKNTYVSAHIHRRQKDTQTHSPRERERTERRQPPPKPRARERERGRCFSSAQSPSVTEISPGGFQESTSLVLFDSSFLRSIYLKKKHDETQEEISEPWTIEGFALDKVGFSENLLKEICNGAF